jgi:hypothetical protein
MAYLVKRLLNWRPSSPGREKLDNAVRVVVAQSLFECIAYEGNAKEERS